MRYRKKPIEVEAYQTDKEIIIHTLEGDMKANIGDYIITGINGEKYPCKPDIFEKTYDKAESDGEDMTPMQAWSIISANLMELYKRRNANDCKPYVDAEITAEVICYMALKKMEGDTE